MKGFAIVSLCLVSMTLSGACGRRNPSQADKKNIVDLATRPVPSHAVSVVTVMGCITASGDHFALTQLNKESSSTETYQLTNADDQLRTLVGKEVRVVGEATPPQSAEVRETDPSVPAPTSGTANDKANVSSQEDTRIATRSLAVTSVAPTGGNCAPAAR